MTTKETAAAAKARLEITSSTTRQLCDMMMLTDAINTPEVPTVRGWLMDELERRNPESFNAWLDSDADDDTLHDYFHC